MERTGRRQARPVAEYDASQTDLYKLVWSDDKKSAGLDLLPHLQPRNMQVAPGFVLDVPISVEVIGNDELLILHFNEGELRKAEEGPSRPRKKKEDGVKKEESAKKDDGTQKDGAQAERQTAASGENQTEKGKPIDHARSGALGRTASDCTQEVSWFSVVSVTQVDASTAAGAQQDHCLTGTPGAHPRTACPVSRSAGSAVFYWRAETARRCYFTNQQDIGPGWPPQGPFYVSARV